MRLVPYVIAIAVTFVWWLTSSGQPSVITESFHSVLVAVIAPILSLINTPAFVYSASLLIVVAAIGLSVNYYFRAVRPSIRALRLLHGDLLALPATAGRPGESFAALRQLGDALRERRLFLSAWAAFQGQMASQRRIPENPFTYFAVTDPTVTEFDRRGLMHAMPGYFTSLGLIFTFTGLVVALYFAARGFRSGNIEEARGAILQLLNTASFKFLTSVAALGSALLLSVVLRIGNSYIRRERDQTIAMIEACISMWRDLQAPGAGDADLLVDMTRHLETLVSKMSACVTKLDLIAGRLMDAGSKQHAE